MVNNLFYILGNLQVVLALHIFCQKMFGINIIKKTGNSFGIMDISSVVRYMAIVLYVVIDCIVYFLFDDAIIFFTTSIILYFLFTFAYSLKIGLKNLIATLIFIAFGVCSELLASFSVSYAVSIFGGYGIDNEIVAVTLLSRIIFFVLIVVVKQIIEYQSNECSNDNSFLLTLIIPILSVFIVLYLFSLASFNQQSIVNSDSIGAYLSVTAIIIMNVLSFYIFDRFHRINLIEKEDVRLKQTILVQQAHFDEEKTVRDSIRKMKHDYKNMLIALKTNIQNENPNEALVVINNELGNIEEIQLPSSNNLTIDSIMSYKASIAAEKNIKIISIYKIEEVIDIDSSDICILIGNALDNAIEYLEKNTGCEPLINVRIIGGKGLLDIKITNNISGEVMIADNMIKTTKSEIGHGYGLKSAEYIAEKYGGLMELHCEDNVFSFEVIMYEKRRKE